MYVVQNNVNSGKMFVIERHWVEEITQLNYKLHYFIIIIIIDDKQNHLLWTTCEVGTTF